MENIQNTAPEIRHNPTLHQFYVNLEGHKGFLDYVQSSATFDILHVHVPEEFRGHGIASALVKDAVKYARENGLKIIPTCSYAAVWFKRHPEENSILSAQ